ncbi:MAG: XisI protein [Blastocatellia bacterium]
MDSLGNYREILRRILIDHTRIAAPRNDVRYETIFDQSGDHYLVVLQGWDGHRRIHACIIHVDIIDSKFWIQHDGTDYGIANKLFDAGVPKDHIVLGFKSQEMRKYTEFAAA